MQSLLVKINNTKILQKIREKAFSLGKVASYDKAYKIFSQAKNKMLKEFDSDSVTLELIGGRDDPYGFPNISDTLNGYGNLYSFLGFNSGRDPIMELRELLDNTIILKYSTFRYDTWYFKVKFPEKTQLEEATQMDWEPVSWVEAIEETGIGNLSYFLNEANKGRSTGGIIVQNEVNDGLQFHTTQYLSKIFQVMEDNI